MRCAPPRMKSSMAAVSPQSVRVQNTRAPSMRMSAARQPSLASACRRERNAPSMSGGKKCSLHRRKRVIAAVAMDGR